MKIYVASKFENKEYVREVHQVLREDGHTITHDWTGEDAANYKGEALEEYLCSCANKDVTGVLDSQCLLLLHYPKIQGGASEFGIAIAALRLLPNDDRIIVVIDAHKPENPRNIFFHLKEIRHAADLAEARNIIKAHERVLTASNEVG